MAALRGRGKLTVKSEIEVIPSANAPDIGAHLGVRIRNRILNLTAESTSKRTQYANKLNTMDMLKMQPSAAETLLLVPPAT